MNKIPTFGFLAICIALLLFLSSCISPKTYEFDEYVRKAPTGFILVDPVFMEDLRPQGGEQLADFEANLFVGAIRFSGGIIIDHGNDDISRSKNIELGDEVRYRSYLSDLLTRIVEKFISAKNPPISMSPGGSTKGLLLGVMPGVGDKDWERVDNINKPYRRYSIKVDGALNLTAGNVSEGQLIVVPVVECAYSHTAGWFYDQSSGCTAGVRLKLHVLIIDPVSGKLVFRYYEDFREIPGYEAVLSYHRIIEIFESFGVRAAAHLVEAWNSHKTI